MSRRDECEVVWHGASWREVPRESPPAPAPLSVTIDGVLQRRVVDAMLDGHARSIYQVAKRARLTTAQCRKIVSALVQAQVLLAFDTSDGPRDQAGAVRRRYQLVASIATGTASDQLRARVLAVLDAPLTLREVVTRSGVRFAQTEHLVRRLWLAGLLQRQREPGARIYRYWRA